MRTWIVLLLLAATASAQPPKPYWTIETKILVPVFLVLTAADATATEHIWQSGPGWSEANPLIPGTRAGRIGYFSFVSAGVVVGSYMLHRRCHTRWSRVLLYVGVADEAQASAYTWSHP